MGVIFRTITAQSSYKWMGSIVKMSLKTKPLMNSVKFMFNIYVKLTL